VLLFQVFNEINAVLLLSSTCWSF